MFVVVTPLFSTLSPPPHLLLLATRQPPSFVSAPRATCLRLSPFTTSVHPPPLPHLACNQVPVGPWGFAHCGYLHLTCVSASTSLCVSMSPGIFWCLVSLLGGRLCARTIGQVASTPWQLLAPVLASPLLGYSGAFQDPCLSLPPHPHTSLPCCIDPIL